MSAAPEIEAGKGALPTQADIAVVTVLPEEYEAVCSTFGLVEQDTSSSDPLFSIGSVRSFKTSTERVVVCYRCLEKGNNSANTLTSHVLWKWHPRYLLLVGIAGGVSGREELELGDVVFHSDIKYYELVKVTSAGNLGRSGLPHEPSPLLRDITRRISNWDSSRWNEGGLACPSESGRGARVIEGQILCGDKLWSDPNSEALAALLQKYDRAIAVEMESYGVGSAAYDYHRYDWLHFLVVKGISDFVNEGANQETRDMWRTYASHVAARVAHAIVRSIGDMAADLADYDPTSGLLDTRFFHGHQEQLTAVANSIEGRTKLIVVRGPSGIGKTYLVHRGIFLSRQRRPRGRVRFLNCDSFFSSPLEHIAGALRLDPEPHAIDDSDDVCTSEALIDSILQELAERDYVLVVDQCEVLLPHSPEQTEQTARLDADLEILLLRLVTEESQSTLVLITEKAPILPDAVSRSPYYCALDLHELDKKEIGGWLADRSFRLSDSDIADVENRIGGSPVLLNELCYLLATGIGDLGDTLGYLEGTRDEQYSNWLVDVTDHEDLVLHTIACARVPVGASTIRRVLDVKESSLRAALDGLRSKGLLLITHRGLIDLPRSFRMYLRSKADSGIVHSLNLKLARAYRSSACALDSSLPGVADFFTEALYHFRAAGCDPDAEDVFLMAISDLYDKGARAFIGGDYEAARQSAQQLVALARELPEGEMSTRLLSNAHYYIAKAMSSSGAPLSESIDPLWLAVNTDPRNTKAWMRLIFSLAAVLELEEVPERIRDICDSATAKLQTLSESEGLDYYHPLYGTLLLRRAMRATDVAERNTLLHAVDRALAKSTRGSLSPEAARLGRRYYRALGRTAATPELREKMLERALQAIDTGIKAFGSTPLLELERAFSLMDLGFYVKSLEASKAHFEEAETCLLSLCNCCPNWPRPLRARGRLKVLYAKRTEFREASMHLLSEAVKLSEELVRLTRAPRERVLAAWALSEMADRPVLRKEDLAERKRWREKALYTLAEVFSADEVQDDGVVIWFSQCVLDALADTEIEIGESERKSLLRLAISKVGLPSNAGRRLVLTKIRGRLLVARALEIKKDRGKKREAQWEDARVPLQKAVAVLRKACDLDPVDPHSRIHLANALRGMAFRSANRQSFESLAAEALGQAEKATEIEPLEPLGWLGLFGLQKWLYMDSAAYATFCRYLQVETDEQRALRSAPLFAEVAIHLTYGDAGSDTREALAGANDLCARAFEAGNRSARLLVDYGRVLSAQGLREESEAIVGHILAELGGAGRKLFPVFSALKEEEDALGDDVITRGALLGIIDPAIWNALGTYFKEYGDVEGADICYELALKANKHDVIALTNRAMLIVDTGDTARLAEATKFIDKAESLADWPFRRWVIETKEALAALRA